MEKEDKKLDEKYRMDDFEKLYILTAISEEENKDIDYNDVMNFAEYKNAYKNEHKKDKSLNQSAFMNSEITEKDVNFYLIPTKIKMGEKEVDGFIVVDSKGRQLYKMIPPTAKDKDGLVFMMSDLKKATNLDAYLSSPELTDEQKAELEAMLLSTKDLNGLNKAIQSEKTIEELALAMKTKIRDEFKKDPDEIIKTEKEKAEEKGQKDKDLAKDEKEKEDEDEKDEDGEKEKKAKSREDKIDDIQKDEEEKDLSKEYKSLKEKIAEDQGYTETKGIVISIQPVEASLLKDRITGGNSIDLSREYAVVRIKNGNGVDAYSGVKYFVYDMEGNRIAPDRSQNIGKDYLPVGRNATSKIRENDSNKNSDYARRMEEINIQIIYALGKYKEAIKSNETRASGETSKKVQEYGKILRGLMRERVELDREFGILHTERMREDPKEREAREALKEQEELDGGGHEHTHDYDPWNH